MASVIQGTLYRQQILIAKNEEGVHTINVTQYFRVLIIVTKEISFKRHPWLCALTRNLDEQQAGMLIELEKRSRTEWEYNRAEEVMYVVMSAKNYYNLKYNECKDSHFRVGMCYD